MIYRSQWDCIPCAIGSLITPFKKGLVTTEQQEQTMRALLDYYPDLNELGQQAIAALHHEEGREKNFFLILNYY